MKMSKKTIQYASQLFLSFEPVKNPTKIIKPVAKTLILAGNNFRFGSKYNKEWLKYLSESWDDVCIIPGILEYSCLGFPTKTLTTEINIDNAEMILKNEFIDYSNIHFLNRKSVNVSDEIRISGIIRWPNYIETIKDDPAFIGINDSYLKHTKLWKQEDDEWVRETIMNAEYSIIPHVIASYLCPLPHLLGNKHLSIKNVKLSELPFYSLYYALWKYEQPLQGWIYGIPHTNINGYCSHGRTFLGCNSRNGKGYVSQMIMSI
jgi:hypothetical protein